MPDWILLVTVLFAAAGAFIVLVLAWRSLRAQRKAAPPKPRTPKPVQTTHAIAFACPVCQHEVAFGLAELRPLTPPEVALIVGQRRQAAGHKLSEAVCPQCEACFTFFTDTKRPELLGTNIYHAQQRGNRCTDCGRPLARLPWDPKKVTKREQVLDALEPLHGLDCDHCGAVCCLACCEEVSRNRSTDDTLMCPRCRRRPMQTLHYF